MKRATLYWGGFFIEMASTEETLQDTIQALYEGDTSTPGSTTEEYLARREMINAGINRWEEENVDWNELRATLTGAADGDKTTSGSTTQYDCPTNFRKPGGYVRLYTTAGQSTYYSVIDPQKVQLFDNTDKKVCYFTGNPQDGYKLNFLDTHDAGQTISYEYYKTADKVTATSTTPEMADPYFIVYFVLARLYKEERPGLARDYFNEAEARLSQMKVKNMTVAPWQENTIEDRLSTQGIGGFGT